MVVKCEARRLVVCTSMVRRDSGAGIMRFSDAAWAGEWQICSWLGRSGG